MRLPLLMLCLLAPVPALAVDAPPSKPPAKATTKPVAKPAAKKSDKKAAAKKDDVKDVDKELAAQSNTVVLQGLNKVTGHISRLEGPVGTTMRFDRLEIVVHRCWKSAPEDMPENAALLEISELKPGEGPQRIFLGWMFSSSPGLSSLEHPVYDINVLSCSQKDEEKKDDTKSDKKDDAKPEKKDAPKPSGDQPRPPG